ncbi:MAG: hypothetical protein DRP50_08245 [Thermotoga sp.]|nr:DUF370 domain-containing protein [Thermotogota bacterium]RKX51840.1 MAG: hypothetical protein DRP50_08245 [Thermotoga sp.]
MKSFVSIGFGNMIMVDRIISILTPESAPIRKLKEAAREKGNVVDVTHGRKTRSIILTDSRYIILSALQPSTITERCRTVAATGDMGNE